VHAVYFINTHHNKCTYLISSRFKLLWVLRCGFGGRFIRGLVRCVSCACTSCFVSITNILTLVLLGLDSTGSMGVDMEDLKVWCACTHMCTCLCVCVCVCVNAYCTCQRLLQTTKTCDLNVILIVITSDLHI